MKPLDNSVIAKDSINSSISSMENSLDVDIIKTHRDEEITDSESEDNLNPH